MRRLRCVGLVLLAWALCAVGLAQAQTRESRVALVIGNSNYKSSPLRNPVNDATDMANKLRSYGFEVIERHDLNARQIGSTLREFRARLSSGSVAVFFYAGHGVQIKGENYLPTVDADIRGEEDVPQQSLAMRQVMDVLGDAKTRINLVFLDACRDNPYARSFRSGSRGLGREGAPSGTLISFATRPGSVAADGDGRNGLYTGSLLKAMNEKHQPIEQVLKRVVSAVKAQSNSQQEPWMEGSIEGDFCFGSCTDTAFIAAPAPLPAYVAQPQSQPPPVRFEGATRTFLRRYFADWSADDEKAIRLVTEALDDQVLFYGKRTAKADIVKMKIDFIKRWPIRSYTQREDTTAIQCQAERKTCTVTGIVDWSARSVERAAASKGVSEFSLVLDFSAGSPRIVMENGKTLDRQSR